MALEYIKKDGSENGATVADKINAIIDEFGETSNLTSDLNANGFAIFGQTIKKWDGLSLDVSNASLLKATLSSDSTIVFTNIPIDTCEWLVEIDTNGYTVNWDSNVEWDGDGTEPEWSSGSDLVYFYRLGNSSAIKGMMTRAGA